MARGAGSEKLRHAGRVRSVTLATGGSGAAPCILQTLRAAARARRKRATGQRHTRFFRRPMVAGLWEKLDRLPAPFVFIAPADLRCPDNPRRAVRDVLQFRTRSIAVGRQLSRMRIYTTVEAVPSRIAAIVRLLAAVGPMAEDELTALASAAHDKSRWQRHHRQSATRRRRVRRHRPQQSNMRASARRISTRGKARRYR